MEFQKIKEIIARRKNGQPASMVITDACYSLTPTGFADLWADLCSLSSHDLDYSDIDDLRIHLLLHVIKETHGMVFTNIFENRNGR